MKIVTGDTATERSAELIEVLVHHVEQGRRVKVCMDALSYLLFSERTKDIATDLRNVPLEHVIYEHVADIQEVLIRGCKEFDTLFLDISINPGYEELLCIQETEAFSETQVVVTALDLSSKNLQEIKEGLRTTEPHDASEIEEWLESVTGSSI